MKLFEKTWEFIMSLDNIKFNYELTVSVCTTLLRAYMWDVGVNNYYNTVVKCFTFVASKDYQMISAQVDDYIYRILWGLVESCGKKIAVSCRKKWKIAERWKWYSCPKIFVNF